MLRTVFLLAILGCGGGSKTAPPSNTTTTANGSAEPRKVVPSEDCLEGGVIHEDGKSEPGCKFFGEVMGPPKDGGTGIHVLKCCYATAEAACKHTLGCEADNCVFDAKATGPTQVACKTDKTHDGRMNP